MACENPTWDEERIANELSLKFGIRISPRTVGKYLERGQPRGSSGQRWSTFVRNHANAIIACDFFVSVTANFRILYVFVAIEVGSRRILHCNVTQHPAAEWTTQQFREFLAFDHPYRFLIHDRRPHSSLGPGIPEPPQAKVPASVHRHRLPAGYGVKSTTVLGGLYHEYRLEKEAA